MHAAPRRPNAQGGPDESVTEVGCAAEHSVSGVAMTEERYHQRYGIDAPAEWLGHDIAEEHPALARMAARRTHRQYATTPVSPAIINQLLDIAFAAPSKSDFQQATVIRVVDAAKRASIAAEAERCGAARSKFWSARPARASQL